MNENAERWVKALESGKYQQNTNGYLRTAEDLYCCLGVGCDLMNSDDWKANEKDKVFEFVDPDARHVNISTLSDRMLKWLGLQGCTGSFTLTEEVRELICGENDGQYPGIATGKVPKEDDITYSSLAGLNDAGISFLIIAKVIRMEPPELFKDEE